MKNLFLKFYKQFPLRITLLILFFAFIMTGFFLISSKSNFKEYLKENGPNLYNIAGHLNLVCAGDAAHAGQALDTVFVHQVIYTTRHFAHDVVLALHHLANVHRQPVG